MKLGDSITSCPLQDAILGNSKQTTLVLHTVLTCLDTIAFYIGKEVSNPDMLWNAHKDTWTQSTSPQFAAANCVLITCLQQLDHTATAEQFYP